MRLPGLRGRIGFDALGTGLVDGGKVVLGVGVAVGGGLFIPFACAGKADIDPDAVQIAIGQIDHGRHIAQIGGAPIVIGGFGGVGCDA